MKAFDDENAAGFESSLEDIRHFTASDVAEQDQVPAALSKIEILHPLDLGLETHTQLPRGLLCERDRLVGRVEPGDVPPLLREPNRVPALAHSHVESRPGLASLGDLHEKRVGFGIEAGLLRRQDLIPAFD